MSALVIDTSAWISYFAGEETPALEEALSDGRVYLPPIVAAELVSAKMPARHRLALEDFLGDLPMCRCDLPHLLAAGRLRSHVSSKGVTLSTPDAHVAQCALDLDAALLTYDKVFAAVARHAPLKLVRT